MLRSKYLDEIVDEVQRLESALARGAKKTFTVELLDKGTWYPKGSFFNKSVAVKKAKRLTDETGRRSRVVEIDIRTKLQVLGQRYNKHF